MSIFFSDISKYFMSLNCWFWQHCKWKWHQNIYNINYIYCCTILKKYLILIKRTVECIFFLTIFTLQINAAYTISFMHQKHIFAKDIFFVSKSTLTHGLWPQHATDTWFRIKNYSVLWTFMLISKYYDIWPTLRHVGNMLTTFPTKSTVQQFDRKSINVHVNGIWKVYALMIH